VQVLGGNAQLRTLLLGDPKKSSPGTDILGRVNTKSAILVGGIYYPDF
jgi:hypothetical protein